MGYFLSLCSPNSSWVFAAKKQFCFCFIWPKKPVPFEVPVVSDNWIHWSLFLDEQGYFFLEILPKNNHHGVIKIVNMNVNILQRYFTHKNLKGYQYLWPTWIWEKHLLFQWDFPPFSIVLVKWKVIYIYIYIYICVCVCVYIYIYIYIHCIVVNIWSGSNNLKIMWAKNINGLTSHYLSFYCKVLPKLCFLEIKTTNYHVIYNGNLIQAVKYRHFMNLVINISACTVNTHKHCNCLFFVLNFWQSQL